MTASDPAGQWDDLPAPDVPGYRRGPGEAVPGTAYQAGQPVWVWPAVGGAWRRGEVQGVSPYAVQVRYQPDPDAPGWLADTVTTVNVAPRRVQLDRSDR